MFLEEVVGNITPTPTESCRAGVVKLVAEAVLAIRGAFLLFLPFSLSVSLHPLAMPIDKISSYVLVGR